MATHDDWSTLPSDLVNRVGDCFLATNDLDYYVAFRAVCHPWRAATDDPRSSPPADPRFRPRHWVMVSRQQVPSAADADVPADGDTTGAGTVCVFVNVATGRVLRMDLPLLRRHYLIATAAGGFLVLADRDHPPHAMRVLNPLTGSSIRFMAPAPSEVHVTAHLFLAGPAAPTLALVCRGRSCLNFDDGKASIYSADPSSERLRVEYHRDLSLSSAGSDDEEDEADGGHYSFSIHDSDVISVLCRVAHRQAVGGGGGDLMMRDDDILARSFGAGAGDHGARRMLLNPCFLVESAGETLLVGTRDRITGTEVFRLDAKRALFEPVGGMGSRALLVGDRRCLFVDADNFASIRGNCLIVYDEFPALLVYDLTEMTETSLDVTTTDDASRSGPEDEEGSALFVHLLAEYCSRIRASELGAERCSEDFFEKIRITREIVASKKDFSDDYDSDD